MSKLKIGSLFSGYMGLDMAVESVLDAETAWFVEFDKAPSKILAHHRPDVPNYGDVTKVDWAAVEPVDVITGGSPCQDLSHAGKRQGMTEGTRSNLWVAMREAIAALRPSLVIWENVAGAYSATAESELDRGACRACVCGGTDRWGGLHPLGVQPNDVPTASVGGDEPTGTAVTQGASSGVGRDALSSSDSDRQVGGSVDLAYRRAGGCPPTSGDAALPATQERAGAGGLGCSRDLGSADTHEGRTAAQVDSGGSGSLRADQAAATCTECQGSACDGCGGCLNASEDSDLEPRQGLLGDRPARPSLRALGRVLGDLATLGYDCRWHGLRAADIGAPHGRFRVFVVAQSADLGHEWPRPSRGGWTGPTDSDRRTLTLLPTLKASNNENQSSAWANGPNLGEAIATLLPTPAVNDMGEGKTPEAWDEWTAKMQAAHGNGNGHGKSLAIEAQRLLPTPRAAQGETRNSTVYHRYYQGQKVINNLENAVADLCLPEHGTPRTSGVKNVSTPEAGPREELSDLWDTADSQEVCERQARGPERLSSPEVLLPELREHPDGDHALGASVPGEAAPEESLRGVRNEEAAPRPPQGPELAERRPGEPTDAVRVMPSETALAGGSSAAHGCCEASRRDGACPWGIYSAAIHRWEMVLGRVAPPATAASKKGTPQLSAEFSEFLMGLPAGHVTDVPGLSRNDQLKALGNGVVPQQAAAALRFLLSVQEVAA